MNTQPFEITEKFLGSIGTPQDLLSLALTSRYWAELIIPRHIQYRELHLGPDGQTSSLWNHLAERKDLAKNIREVRLTSMDRKWEIRPTTLVPSCDDQSENERNQERSFIQAFQNFEKLECFTWKQHDCPVFMVPYRNPRLLEILNNASHLSSLHLSQCESRTEDAFQEWQILTGFRNLKHLHLHGSLWASFTLGSSLTSMLLRCSDITELVLSYNVVSPSFVTCFFPWLRHLSIYSSPWIDQSSREILKFIKVHETIEELTYYPVFGVRLLPGSLPALKEIASSHDFTMSILEDKSVPNRALRSIAQISINPDSMRVLREIDPSEVQELYLWRYDNIQSIRQLGKIFPAITRLEIPKLGMSLSEIYSTLDDHIFTLSHFPRLECIMDTPIRALILDLKGHETRKDAIKKLANACPNLRSIIFYESQRRTIILSRDGDDTTWEDIGGTRD
ncbi:hypothetical protein BDZ94DRAFT_1260400 [Collybia nuda]|uniref:F-box domain-containing protein n=1 Tax=Collybia nuda TaxID=64659 RepID=A0A9P6CI00_9AGAR|nr:hypothetical protein BDZ94DRAFT_1260400 [Collybia nuda]